MAKSADCGNSGGADNSTTDARNDLPGDPDILHRMNEALNDFIERFRAEFTDNSLVACLGLEALLRDAQGKRAKPQTLAPRPVKPDFFVAAKFLNLDAIEDQLARLQSAVKAVQSDALGAEERLPFSLSLDRKAECAHYQKQQRSAVNKIRKVNDCLADLLDIFVRARVRIAAALAESGRWSRPRSPDEWSKIFQRSWDALKGYFDRQEIRNKKLSSKLYRVHLADLPRSYKD